jgi:DNA-binding response OmpR family regulator
MTETSDQTPSKRRVIVVDDEQVIANTLAIILNQAGFEARAVFSGEQAIELLESFQPEMLIADVVMPGMTGYRSRNCYSKQASKVQYSSLLRTGRYHRVVGTGADAGP